MNPRPGGEQDEIGDGLTDAGGAGVRPGAFSELLAEVFRRPLEDASRPGPSGFTAGQSVGRFELLREVGRGGFGVVYEARDRELGRSVAFKALKIGARLEVKQEQLLREADAAARLSHPNIVTLYDVGRCEQGPYLVFEFLRGQTLAERLQAGVAPSEALRIAAEIARGVAHAHAHGVIHRDLKPSNVVLCDDGQAKVLDFGMAHVFGRRKLEGGSRAYMAPEQARGAPEDERTDVFAIGVMLFEMLSGQRPVEGDAPRGSRGSSPALKLPQAPQLEVLVGQMLQPDPVARPRDAGEVLTRLEAIRQEMAASAGALSARPVRTPAPGRLRRLFPLLVVGLLVLTTALAAGGWHLVRRSGAAPGHVEASIAVMPFTDLTPQHDQGYFADGVAEEILNALGRVEGLHVPGRSASFYYRGKALKLAEVARELKVSNVLEGTVRKEGNRVRVTADIVSARDGYRLWSETYDRDLTGIFAVQEEIARAVVRALKLQLLARSAPTTRGYATSNPEVYDQYLIGRQAYYQFSAKGFRLAAEAYQRALALDPNYAPAWAGLGIPLYYLADGASTLGEVTAQRQRALAAAEKAVALAADLPDALSTRGILRGYVAYDWPGARDDFERALALKGNDADGRRRYACYLANAGRMPEALIEARRSVDLDPLLGPSWVKLADLQKDNGDFQQAHESLRRALQILPDSNRALSVLAKTLLLEGKPAEALAAFEQCPSEASRLFGRAVVEHTLGHEVESRRALEALVAKYPNVEAISVAQAYAWRGEREPAFQWLERALAQRDGGDMVECFRTTPFLDSIRSDPRYVSLLQRMNLFAAR